MKNLLDIKSTFDNYDSDENKSAYEGKYLYNAEQYPHSELL